MATRFQKRKKIAPGLRLNIGKRGVSLNVGVPGLSVTKGRDGTHINTGLPGTGLSRRTKIGGGKAQPEEKISDVPTDVPADIAAAQKTRDGKVFLVTFVIAIVVFAWMF